MSDVIVRRFEEKDADKLYEMIKLAIRTPLLNRLYDESAIEFVLNEYSKDGILAIANERHIYVAELNDEIVGSGAVSVKDDAAYISLVYVNPNIQGKGIGRKVITTLEQDEICQEYRKITLSAMLSASKFYQKLGYSFKYAVPEMVLDGNVLDTVYLEKTI